jgi:MFS transporter, AAHS family, 4-hydroxybenzoate transporter
VVYLVGVFAVAAIGQLGHAVIPVSIAIFAAGFCVVGGQIAANALTAGYYPTSVRATGVGWALGIGRVGSIIGPLVAGILIDAKWSTGALFMAAAAAAACAAVASLLLSRIAAASSANEQTSSMDATLKPATTART